MCGRNIATSNHQREGTPMADPSWSELTQSVITVGAGRGFVVEIYRHKRIVLTAAHCLPSPPVCDPGATNEHTYRDLLAPLSGNGTVWAECLFADPIADIAVLDEPDYQELFKEADAYNKLIHHGPAFRLGKAPKDMLYDWNADSRPARILNLAGEWLACNIKRYGHMLSVEDTDLFHGGMSGSPIISPDGKAIGVVSSEDKSPAIHETLPARITRPATTATLRGHASGLPRLPGRPPMGSPRERLPTGQG
jgi:hypothetical protein